MVEQAENSSKTERNLFTLKKFAKVITWRQKKKKSNTTILIWGAPRTGKTNLGFKILIPYLAEKRRQFEAGEGPWNPSKKWSMHFKEFFAGSSKDMNDKIKKNPEESYCFDDEGTDIVGWQHQMERDQTDLIELLLKVGKKKMLTIIIIPMMSLIQKEILSMSHYLFIIPDEPQGDKNVAYLFKNYKNPILRERAPFGIKNIIKDVEKNEWLGDIHKFTSYLMKKNTYVTKFSYRSIDEKIYDLYEKMVKDPIMLSSRKKRRMVSQEAYNSLEYAFGTILYNLYTKDDKKIAQIETLMRDKFGEMRMSRNRIKGLIDELSMMEIKPEFKENADILEEPKPEEPLEDVEIVDAP